MRRYNHKYKFKSKSEFESEFGLNWRNVVELSFPGGMDSFLDTFIENEVVTGYDENIYNLIDNMFKNQRRLIRIKNRYGNFFNISKDMIKLVSVLPDYSPRKIVKN